MAHRGPKVQEPSLLQLTGARCSIIYNPLSWNGYHLQHPTLLPCSCHTAQDWLPHHRVRGSAPAAGKRGCCSSSAAPHKLLCRNGHEPLQPTKWRGVRSVHQPPLGQNLNATLVPLDWHSPNTACLFCWHIGLSLLPSHIVFPLGYNSHLHSTYYNILQQ